MKRSKMPIYMLAASTLFLTGCTGKNEVVNYDIQPEAKYTISFFGNKHEAANVEVIEKILDGYMEENNNVNITYESLKGAEYFDVLLCRDTSGNLDDVFMTNHDVILELSENDSLSDLTDLVEDVPFLESIRSDLKSSDGNIYWVPTTVSAFGLYCNLDLLEEHQQEIPATLEEWESVCDYFVSEGITPIIANNDISLKTLALSVGFYPVFEKGTQIETFDRLNSGKETLSSYLTDGFALAKSFCEKGYIDATAALNTAKTSDDLEEFIKGESPFMLTGAWAAGRVKKMEPDFEFQVVPYPVLEDGSVLMINPDTLLSVSAKGEQQGYAKEFVAYFLRTENIRQFADNQSSFSPLEDDFEPSLEEIRPIVDSYRTKPSVIGANSHIQFPIWDITAEVSKKLLAGEETESLMEWMDEQVAQALK